MSGRILVQGDTVGFATAKHSSHYWLVNEMLRYSFLVTVPPHVCCRALQASFSMVETLHEYAMKN